MTFADTVKAKYPNVKVLYLNGDDEPDINGWGGLALELPNGLKMGVRFHTGHRDEAEAKLFDWLKRNYHDGPTAV